VAEFLIICQIFRFTFGVRQLQVCRKIYGQIYNMGDIFMYSF